jgi:hypothetical protein
VAWHGEHGRGSTYRPVADRPGVRTGRRLAVGEEQPQTLGLAALDGLPVAWYRSDTEVGAAERWRILTSEKLVEVNELITQLREMRARLKEALRCECSSLDECAELLADP